MTDLFEKWRSHKMWTTNVANYVEFTTGSGFVYPDLSVVETVYDYDEENTPHESYVVTIGNIIQHFTELDKAEAHLWKWHAKDNSHDNYDDLSHLSTTREEK